MTRAMLTYHPDRWAHDLDEWWAPLAAMAAGEDLASESWLRVLGVAEFFDQRLLGQQALLTPWICLAASAVCAAGVRHAAEVTRGDADQAARRGAAAGAAAAFGLALSLHRLRWNGRPVGAVRTSSAELARAGRQALAGCALPREPAGNMDALALVAGWLEVSGHPVAPVLAPMRSADQWLAGAGSASDIISGIARHARRHRPCRMPLLWGTAHLVSRLASGALDELAAPEGPEGLPAQACANVLLVAGHGEMGLFEVRRQRSELRIPPGHAVPDLARLAFIRPSRNFVASVADAVSAARVVHDGTEQLRRRGEILSWSLHLAGDDHPLAERRVMGRSAGLGAYVAFRSLASAGIFAERDVAFTGQVARDGAVGAVRDAKGKIEAAARHGIRLVIHPAGQPWRDPKIKIQLWGVHRAEDALVAAAKHLRDVRSYLEAACQFVRPEPWMRAWLDREGLPQDQMPLLEVMCREIPAGVGEPVIQPCAAHLLATRYPATSFAIGADAGGGSTFAARRMVAESARMALDALRAAKSGSSRNAFVLPLYLPLWERPSTWDDVIRASVEAIPGIEEPSLDVSAALASALRGDATRGWRALVVVDGTDRGRNPVADDEQGADTSLIALLAGRPVESGQAWRPRREAQLVLCGRSASPAHQRAADALRQIQPGSAVMRLEPLSDREIDRFVAASGCGTSVLADWNRDLAANPLLLALSLIAGHPSGDCVATDLFDRGLDVLLGSKREQRGFLAEIAFRAAGSTGEPAGEFGIRDIAAPGTEPAVEEALADEDSERALANALRLDERRAFASAETRTHLLTATPGGWRFFHDRVFAFLVADRIVRHAADADDDDVLFGMLGRHLGDPFWADAVEATGRLLELRGSPVISGQV